MKALAEQLVAHTIPLAGRRREELLRFGAPLGQHRLQAALILPGGRRRPDLLADQRPQSAAQTSRARRASSRRALLVPSARAEIQPLSASAFRCRLTVDCGSCMMPHSSDTVSSCRSSSSRIRLRVVSASAERWSSMAGGRATAINPLIRIKGYIERRARCQYAATFLMPMPISQICDDYRAHHLITDYLLGTLCRSVRVLLLKRNVALRQTSVRMWGFALCGMATASFAGGTYHGFHQVLESPRADVVEVDDAQHGHGEFFSAGLHVHRLVSRPAAVALRSRCRKARRLRCVDARARRLRLRDLRLRIDAAVCWCSASPADARRRRAPRVYRAGIAVSIAAAVLQQSGIRLHEHFNHNDLMHVVQMAGVWLLYQGGARLHDAGRRRPNLIFWLEFQRCRALPPKGRSK